MRTLELLIPPPPIWLDARGQAPLQQPETSQPDWHSIGHPLHILATATGLMVGKPLRIRWRAEPAGPRIVGLRSGWLPIEPRALEATIRRTAPPRMGAPLLIVDRDLSADRVAALFEPLEDEVLYLAATRQGEVVSEPLRVGRPECPRPGRWDTAPVRLSVEDHAVAVSYLDTVRRAETPSQLTAVIEELHRDDRDSLVKPVELRCAPRVTMARAVETMDAVAAAVRHSSVILAPSSFVCPAQAAPAP